MRKTLCLLLFLFLLLPGCAQQKEIPVCDGCIADNIWKSEQDFLDNRAKHLQEGELAGKAILRPVPQSEEFSLYHVLEYVPLSENYVYEFVSDGGAVRIHVYNGQDSFANFLENHDSQFGEHKTYVRKSGAVYAKDSNSWFVDHDGRLISYDLPESITLETPEELEKYFTIEAYSLTE